MVRVITQETFDLVVKENVDEFNMTRDEAVLDAKQQFESQGVSLSNIVMTSNCDGEHAVVEALKSMSVAENFSNEECVKQNCETIRTECSRGLAEKVLANKNDAYEILVKLGLAETLPAGARASAIAALASLLDNNPDPLDDRGFKVISDGLKCDDDAAVVASLDMALACCVRHEHNRQNLVRNGLLGLLGGVFSRYPVEVARVWQALVQDDDVRVAYGKAHDHAREIVEEHEALARLVEAVKADSKRRQPKQLALLLSCLSSLSVRNEYCQVVVDKGCLQCMLELLLEPDQHVDVVRECLTLAKTLAGNDNVKKDIRATKGVGILVEAISKNMSSKSVCSAGCRAITAICLRTPENSQMVMEANGAQVLTQILKTHDDAPQVLSACANAIRNIVSRSKHHIGDFVALDVENLLNEAAGKHGKIEDSVKAALRDLELKVKLKEEWKGTAVSLDE